MRSDLPTNFAHLKQHDEQLVRLGMLAERYFAEDPNTCLLELRQLTELLAHLLASRAGLYTSRGEAQFDLLRRLRDQNMLPTEIYQLFGQVRRAGNDANHLLAGDHRSALATLRIAWQLGVWYHRTFGAPQFKSGPFLPPAPPKAESEELRLELARLNASLEEHRAKHATTAESLEAIEAKLRETSEERSFWEQMAVEADQAKVALEKKLAEQQAEASAQPRAAVSRLQTASETAAQKVELDESRTRQRNARAPRRRAHRKRQRVLQARQATPLRPQAARLSKPDRPQAPSARTSSSYSASTLSFTCPKCGSLAMASTLSYDRNVQRSCSGLPSRSENTGRRISSNTLPRRS